jgi:phage tail sheath protein FI
VAVGEGLNRSDFAGLYWPHIVVPDVVGVGRNPTITLPPSGYVAGLMARTDGRRGVWKAPAGTEAALLGTTAIEHQLNDLHSDELNPDGINALRQIPGAGRVVWGARTLVPASEWRYVPVRRTAIFLRSSIYNGIQWAVFEPNDEPLWASLRASIGGFMDVLFRNGAFAGRTSDEAYFVKVDSETTTEVDQAAGVVNILVGFSPLRPAEFVVVKLSQKTQSAS